MRVVGMDGKHDHVQNNVSIFVLNHWVCNQSLLSWHRKRNGSGHYISIQPLNDGVGHVQYTEDREKTSTLEFEISLGGGFSWKVLL